MKALLYMPRNLNQRAFLEVSG